MGASAQVWAGHLLGRESLRGRIHGEQFHIGAHGFDDLLERDKWDFLVIAVHLIDFVGNQNESILFRKANNLYKKGTNKGANVHASEQASKCEKYERKPKWKGGNTSE